MTRGIRAGRQQLSRKRVVLTAVILLVIVFFGVEAVSRILFAPWSIGYFGRDTLPGTWVGTLQAGQGAEFGLLLDLEYRGRSNTSRSSGVGRSNNLQGHATLCTPTGERYDYEVVGYASRSGRVEDLWVEYEDPSLSVLNLRLTGKWRSTVLELATRWPMNPFLPDGNFVLERAQSSNGLGEPFAPFRLSKDNAAAFEDHCQAIRR